MPNTSVHFPGGVLEQLDELAAETGRSRNRLIVEACRRTLERRARWPERFFENDRLSPDDLRTLRRSWRDFDEKIKSGRRSREHPPF